MVKQNWNYIELILQQSKRQDRGEVEFGYRELIMMYSGNESNTCGTGFMINRKYKQAFMNFEAADERICSLRMRRKFNSFTILLVHATQ
jgi:hypothetical protein